MQRSNSQRLGTLSLESDANTGCIQRGGAHTMVFQKDNAKDSKYVRSKAFCRRYGQHLLNQQVDLKDKRLFRVYTSLR